MKKLCAAAIALTILAGTADAQSKMSKETIIVSTQDRAVNDNWVGAMLTFMVIALALGGGAVGAGGGAGSDARLKTDITRVGATPGGLPLYQFRYIGQSTVYEGVMAQDVLSFRPDAVVTGAFGYMLVDYDKLGLTMRVID